MRIDDELKYFLDKFLFKIQDRFKQKMTYEPLKIVFHLSSPITLSHPWMHFDGLISHLLMMDALEDDFFLFPRKFPFSRLLKNVELPPLPIKRTKGLFHSSVSFFDVNDKFLEIMYKKFEDKWIGGGLKKVYRGSGFFKDYRIQHIYIPSRLVYFFVNGDYKTLYRLCSLVTGLGNDTRVGWGCVKDFEIVKMDADYSIVKDNIAMRPIPKFLLEYASEFIIVAWRPPYWAKENVDVCAPPGAEVKFKDGRKMEGNL